MPEEIKESRAERLKAVSAELPDVDYSKGGRKAHTPQAVGHQARLDYAAKDAIGILVQRVGQKRKRIAPDLQRACEYVIDHAIGKARQKIEHSGGILTYGSLAKEAEKIASKPRDVLADAEEIATKKQREADILDPVTAGVREGLERLLTRVDELPEEPAQGAAASMSETSKSDSDSVKAVENLALAEELTPAVTEPIENNESLLGETIERLKANRDGKR